MERFIKLQCFTELRVAGVVYMNRFSLTSSLDRTKKALNIRKIIVQASMPEHRVILRSEIPTSQPCDDPHSIYDSKSAVYEKLKAPFRQHGSLIYDSCQSLEKSVGNKISLPRHPALDRYFSSVHPLSPKAWLRGAIRCTAKAPC